MIASVQFLSITCPKYDPSRCRTPHSKIMAQLDQHNNKMERSLHSLSFKKNAAKELCGRQNKSVLKIHLYDTV